MAAWAANVVDLSDNEEDWDNPQFQWIQPPTTPPHDEPTAAGYDDSWFLDSKAAKDFACIICQLVAVNPVVHTQPGCGALYCRNCAYGFLRHHRNSVGGRRRAPECALRCGDTLSEEKLRPLDGLRRDQLNQLVMRCPHPGCGDLVSYVHYTEHRSEEVDVDLGWCVTCEESRDANHNCTRRIRGLKEDIRNLTSRMRAMRWQAASDRTEVERLREENDRLRQEASLNRVQTEWTGLSNHIRSLHEYRESTRLIVHYKNREIVLEDIPLEAKGREIRNRLESKIGEKVGAILKFNHTPISEAKSLRQHQVGRKPVRLIALDAPRTVTDGTTLWIRVGPAGPVV